MAIMGRGSFLTVVEGVWNFIIWIFTITTIVITVILVVYLKKENDVLNKHESLKDARCVIEIPCIEAIIRRKEND